jgi:hypothetical protein
MTTPRIVLAVAVAIGLVGCGGGSDPAPTTQQYLAEARGIGTNLVDQLTPKLGALTADNVDAWTDALDISCSSYASGRGKNADLSKRLVHRMKFACANSAVDKATTP